LLSAQPPHLKSPVPATPFGYRHKSPRGLTPRSAPDPLRQATLPARCAGLCCTARASRPASAVGVSSNVRPHTAGISSRTTSAFQDARRAQIQASAHARSGQLSAHETYTSEPRRALRGKRPGTPLVTSALRGIRPRPSNRSRQPVRRLAAGNQAVPLAKVVSGGEGVLCLRRKTALRPQQSPAHQTLQRPACGLTLRSTATPHGKPLGRRGALVYAAPRRPSALPRGSRLAQTLGLTNAQYPSFSCIPTMEAQDRACVDTSLRCSYVV
jgi:hypothetical protein